ncbi:MAG: hypothetical protein WDN28_29920 [Chthoniobacter sp.]
MADLPFRNIIREESFEDELRLLIPNAELADEYTAAAENLPVWEPTAGIPTPDSPDVWALLMAPIDSQTMWLLYSFDDAAVVFLGLRTI